jgi:hypothetical protein
MVSKALIDSILESKTLDAVQLGHYYEDPKPHFHIYFREVDESITVLYIQRADEANTYALYVALRHKFLAGMWTKCGPMGFPTLSEISN